MTKTTIINQIANQFNGKVWEPSDKKCRIYIGNGYADCSIEGVIDINSVKSAQFSQLRDYLVDLGCVYDATSRTCKY